jgi:hypothetical protein
VRKARRDLLLVDITDPNFTYKSTFYINFEEFSNFFTITILNMFTQKNIKLHSTCFGSDALSCSCFLKLKRFFTEMIETVPP